MRIPLELAILLAALSVALVWDALHREASAPKRAALVLSALGGIMMAIAGRFPLPPGAVGFSPFVAVGATVVVAGFVAAAIVSLVGFVRRRSVRGGSDRGGGGK